MRPRSAAGPESHHESPRAVGSSVSRGSQRSMMEQNSTSFLAIGVVIGYMVLAATTGVVLSGVIPVMLSINAIGKGEKLAPLALIAAGMAVAFALGLI